MGNWGYKPCKWNYFTLLITGSFVPTFYPHPALTSTENSKSPTSESHQEPRKSFKNNDFFHAQKVTTTHCDHLVSMRAGKFWIFCVSIADITCYMIKNTVIRNRSLKSPS